MTRLPELAVLALLMVMLLFVRSEAAVYGMAVAALALALVVQPTPWGGRGTTPLPHAGTTRRVEAAPRQDR